MTISREHAETFHLNLELHIRYVRPEDIPKLEWGGMFSMDAHIIERSFARHLEDKNIMLVCEANNFPIGQVWIDLEKRAAESSGYIWALRVLPGLRRLGLGTRLLHAAEDLLARRGFQWANISVEAHNKRALELYQRLGYVITSDDDDSPQEYSPELDHFPAPHIILRKPLVHSENTNMQGEDH